MTFEVQGLTAPDSPGLYVGFARQRTRREGVVADVSGSWLLGHCPGTVDQAPSTDVDGSLVRTFTRRVAQVSSLLCSLCELLFELNWEQKLTKRTTGRRTPRPLN